LLFAREGADVVIFDLDYKGASLVAEEVRSLGRNASAVEVNVANEDSVKNGFKEAIGFLGKVDILVNCGRCWKK